jgi:hypothetical protein
MVRLTSGGRDASTFSSIGTKCSANDDVMGQIGHGASLDAKRIPKLLFDWHLDMQRYPHTMKNDLSGRGQDLGVPLGLIATGPRCQRPASSPGPSRVGAGSHRTRL